MIIVSYDISDDKLRTKFAKYIFIKVRPPFAIFRF